MNNREDEIVRLKAIIKNLESENQKLKDELAELKFLFELETERAHLHSELKSQRLLKKNKTQRKAYRKLNRQLENAENNAIKMTAQKAANTRHKETNARKEQAIQEYKNSGLSKNQFAKQAAEKYHVSELTMRKNWLQGV